MKREHMANSWESTITFVILNFLILKIEVGIVINFLVCITMRNLIFQMDNTFVIYVK
jgi:hypothetical protein